MAPTRRTTRQSVLSYDLEEQIREYERYEQELKDRILADRMQREYNQRRSPPAPVVNPVPEQSTSSAPRIEIGPIIQTPGNNNMHEIPPASPILAGAPRIQRRINEGTSGHQAPIPGPIIRRVSRHPGRSRPDPTLDSVSNARTMSGVRTARMVLESESSDDDDIIVVPAPSNRRRIIHNVDNSSFGSSNDSSENRSRNSNILSSSNTSSNEQAVTISSTSTNERAMTISSASSFSTVSSTASVRSRQAFIDDDVQMYQREYEPIDNQPSTSQVMPIAPARKGNPDPTWGDCTMCFEIPIRPQGCNQCHQIIGCKTCVDSWHNTASNPSCPLCRHRWSRKPLVASMPTIDSRRRSRALHRARNQHRNQMSSNDSRA